MAYIGEQATEEQLRELYESLLQQFKAREGYLDRREQVLNERAKKLADLEAKLTGNSV